MKMVQLFTGSSGVWVPWPGSDSCKQHGLAEERNGSYYWTGETEHRDRSTTDDSGGWTRSWP
jgi:hypothetical protein